MIANMALASSFNLGLNKHNIDIQENVILSLSLTSEEHINAIKLTINFPDALLDVQDINIGGSIINAWIEKPYLKSQGEIVMAGIIPGGFLGENGKIVTINLKGKDNGFAQIYLSDLEVLKNDGIGNNAYIQANPIQLKIHNLIFEQQNNDELNDTEIPEDFKPEIARDKNIFQNKWFIVFNTQDKDSGMDHYEILEQRPWRWFKSNWVKAISPYELRDQSLKSIIFVKAIDKVGNERTIKIEPQNHITFFDWWYIVILILLIMWYGVYYFKKYKK